MQCLETSRDASHANEIALCYYFATYKNTLQYLDRRANFFRPQFCSVQDWRATLLGNRAVSQAEIPPDLQGAAGSLFPQPLPLPARLCARSSPRRPARQPQHTVGRRPGELPCSALCSLRTYLEILLLLHCSTFSSSSWFHSSRYSCSPRKNSLRLLYQLGRRKKQCDWQLKVVLWISSALEAAHSLLAAFRDLHSVTFPRDKY